MQVKKIDTTTLLTVRSDYRPTAFDDFVWQEDVTRVVKTAITSSKKSGKPLGHMLLLGSAWYGKTTLAQIISHEIGTNCKIVTAYAISKPADIISMLNALGQNDILFIDEIHRLHPKIEEMLYTAMENYAIDMVMPDGGHVKIPLQPFTLIGATTKSDHLSKPLKSRFVYKFHFAEYSEIEKQKIIWYYLDKFGIGFQTSDLVGFARLLENVPRELYNGCVRVFDYLNVHHKKLELSALSIEEFAVRNKTKEWGLSPLHEAYLRVLETANRPLWLNTIAVKLWLDEKTVEEDIEPLLIKLGFVERGPRGRIEVGSYRLGTRKE